MDTKKVINYLDKIPDDIYKLIMSYIFTPKIHLERKLSEYYWNTSLFINRCCVCNRLAKKVSLAYNCGCNVKEDSVFSITKCEDGCKNQLICFGCAH